MAYSGVGLTPLVESRELIFLEVVMVENIFQCDELET